MGIFTKFFASNEKKTAKFEKDEDVYTEIDTFEPTDEELAEIEIKNLKKEGIRQKNELMRQRLQLDLERKKLEIELEKERLQYEIEKIRAERESLNQADFDDEESDSLDAMFKTLMLSVMAKNGNTSQMTQPQPTAAEVPQVVALKRTVTDEQFKEYWLGLSPSVRKIAKQMNDDTLKAQLTTVSPNLTDDDVKAAVAFVRSN
jgi:hypothetical protein